MTTTDRATSAPDFDSPDHQAKLTALLTATVPPPE